MMCRLLGVARSGYYEWLKKPVSNRAIEDKRLLRLIRASFAATQGVYGTPRVFLDLREEGETCSKHRVARLMRENNIRAKAGYRTRRYIAGKPFELIPDLVKRNFEVSRPNLDMGTRHYVLPNLGRMALPGDRHGSVLPKDCRLGDALDDSP